MGGWGTLPWAPADAGGWDWRATDPARGDPEAQDGDSDKRGLCLTVTEFGNCVQREGAPGPRGAVLPLPGPCGGPGLPVTVPDVRSQQAQPGG